MMSHPTGRLVESNSDYVGHASDVHIEGNHPTTDNLDNVVSLLIRIIVGRED